MVPVGTNQEAGLICVGSAGFANTRI